VLLARFQDANRRAPLADITATAELGLGGGFVAADTVPLGGGSFAVSSRNPVKYPVAGDYPLAVRVVDAGAVRPP
jgi:hypothetical protein